MDLRLTPPIGLSPRFPLKVVHGQFELIKVNLGGTWGGMEPRIYRPSPSRSSSTGLSAAVHNVRFFRGLGLKCKAHMVGKP